MQALKQYLVRRGPNNPFLRMALWMHARRAGFEIRFTKTCIVLRKAQRQLVLSKKQYVQVPWMLRWFDSYFESFGGVRDGDLSILDFSKPAMHCYSASQVSFYFPSIPEDDVMTTYVEHYLPQPDDIVWDVGAHAGASAYFFAQMVGPSGRVYAFEPDEDNYSYLIKNIELHGLRNVIPVKTALSGETGTATFNMDGTMAAGLSEFVEYTDSQTSRTVATRTLQDACAEIGSVPNYVKMDIEGAELAVIRGSLSYLKDHSIHFAIESNHKVGGEYTRGPLEALFSQIGYQVKSSDESGEFMTWASPNR